MLHCAYHYYWGSDEESPLTDYYYDELTKLVHTHRKHLVNATGFHLVDWDSLANCSSLHYIPKASLAYFKTITSECLGSTIDDISHYVTIKQANFHG